MITTKIIIVIIMTLVLPSSHVLTDAVLVLFEVLISNNVVITFCYFAYTKIHAN
jgi:hypothetical protein